MSTSIDLTLSTIGLSIGQIRALRAEAVQAGDTLTIKDCDAVIDAESDDDIAPGILGRIQGVYEAARAQG